MTVETIDHLVGIMEIDLIAGIAVSAPSVGNAVNALSEESEERDEEDEVATTEVARRSASNATKLVRKLIN